MEFDFIEQVYLTLTGDLPEELGVPGVEDLFADGKPCDRHYTQMWEAYMRLIDRLGGRDYDDDGEIMINSLLAICEKVGYAMYRCGAMFGNQEKEI